LKISNIFGVKNATDNAEYPPSQPPASFTIKYFEEDVQRKIDEASKQPGKKKIRNAPDAVLDTP